MPNMNTPRTPLGIAILSVVLAVLGWSCTQRSVSGINHDVTVGIYQNAPKLYFDDENKPAGFFIDLLQEIARQERWNLHYVACAWEDCLTQLEAGDIDLMPDVAFSDERSQRFDFHTISVAHSWSQIYAPAGHALHALPDLIGKRVAVLHDSVQEAYLRQLMTGMERGFTLVPADSLEQAFSLTAQGQADAVVSNQFYGERHASRFKLRETPLIFMPSGLYYATTKARNRELLERIDAHLAAWRQDPESIYFAALRKAMLPPPGLVIPDWAYWTLGGGGGLIMLFIGVTVLLRWQVRQRTAELERINLRLNHVLQASPVVLYALRQTDRDVFVTDWVSDNIQSLFGFSPEEARTPGWWLERLHPDDRDMARASFAKLQEQPHLIHEYRILDAQGCVRHVRDELSYIPAASGSAGVVVGTWSDLTEHREQAERLSYLTHHDPLTGLPNRWLLHDRLEHAIERSRHEGAPIAVVYIDLDRFKNINDTLGHTTGDAMLNIAAQRIASLISAGETLARVGGDEFVLLFEHDATPQKLSHVARTILNAFSAPLEVGPHALTVTASLGISLHPSDGNDADTLLKNAELALYEAKNQGRNTFRFFSAALSAGVMERLVMENALRGAIKRNELVLHFQPQIDLRSGEWIGAEALVRWQQPDLGLVPPGQFIPLAEETGLINDIGKWVLNEACGQMMAWESQGLRLPRMSINLSARQFESETIVDEVTQALRETGLEASRLELEVTESMVMREPEKAASALGQLKAMGARIAIDDFGTGHSSLAYLKRLPLDRLKIDQSFVRDIGNDANDEAISRAVISLARTLGLETIAEGVERDAQAEFLLREGCDLAQGYLFGRPLPADALLAEWRQHHAHSQSAKSGPKE
ncbi:MAG: EAL domain-containing protein [Pseudomonadota bacterium]